VDSCGLARSVPSDVSRFSADLRKYKAQSSQLKNKNALTYSVLAWQLYVLSSSSSSYTLLKVVPRASCVGQL